MTDTPELSHHEMMKLKAKKKTLHRRTQSNTAFDMNYLLNKESHSPELLNQMIQKYNLMNADQTEKAIEASKNTGQDKEVIVDDIDEIPNSGYIVPRYNAANNPMNFIKKRNLSTGSSVLNHQPLPNKLDLLANVEIVNDLIGLNTIFEKRNSIEDIDLGELRSNESNSTSKQNSRNPSQTDAKSLLGNQSTVPASGFQTKKGHHAKHLSADFRPLIQEANTNQSFTPKSGTKEIFIPKKAQPSIHSTIQYPNHDQMDKKSKPTPQVQKPIEKHREPEKVQNFVRGHVRTTSSTVGELSLPHNVNRQKAENFLQFLDKSKSKHTPPSTRAQPKASPSNKHQVFKQLEIKENLPKNTSEYIQVSPTGTDHYTPTTAVLANAKTFQDVINMRNLQSARIPGNKAHSPKPVYLESKVSNLNETVKNLTDKTVVLEEQIRSLNQIIHIMRQQKGDLEKKVKDQDHKIHGLKQLTSRYEAEIYELKAKNIPDMDKFNFHKEFSGHNILNTTDQSTHDSPFNESSSIHAAKEGRLKTKGTPSLNTPITSQGKGYDKKSAEAVISEYKKKKLNPRK